MTTGGIAPAAPAHAAAVPDAVSLGVIVNAVLDPMVVWGALRDEAGAIVDVVYLECNAAAEQHLRRRRADVVGHTLLEAFPGPRADAVLMWVRDVMVTGRPLVLTAQQLPGAQPEKACLFDVSLVQVAGAVVVSWRDTTQVHKTQRALADSEVNLQVLMSSAPVAMNLSTPEGRWTRVNPAMCEFLGRSESDLLARDWQSLTHPDDLEADDILHKEVLSGARDAYRLTKRFLRPDGRAVWGDMSVAAVRNDDGQVRYFVGQIVDVTELIHSRDELTASTQRYRMLAEHTSDIVMQLASDGTIEWVSPSVSAVLGWTRDEVVGSPMGGFIAPKAWPLVARALRYASEHGELATGQFQVRRRGGGWLWVDATSTAVLTEGRDVVRVVRLRDVEAEVRSRRALRDSEERFKAAMTATPIGVALIDRDGHVQQTNPALCAMLRGTPASLRGRTITSLTHPEDRSVDLAMWNRLHSGGGDSLTGEKRLLAEDGTVLWVQSALAMVRDEDGVVASYVAQFLDVSEVHEAQAALEAMAHRDPLTELQNRRALLDRISAILSHPPRTGHRLALLYCDIDHFKTLNDSYGHLAGDAVLVAVAHRLSECLREDDAVGRLGGDEFLILLTEVRDEADVLHVADKVRRAVRAPLTVSGVTLHPSISVGAVLAEPGQQPDTVVSRADHALYEAKQQGRDRVALYRA